MTTMPPATPPTNPPGPQAAPPQPPRNRSWIRTIARANSISSVIVLLVSVLVGGGVIGFFVALNNQAKPKTTTPQVQTLTPEDIRKLTDVGTSLGSSNQVLNIGANSLFRGRVDVGGDLNVGGHFNANGPVTLSQLNISGTTALSGLNVGSNLTVGGTTTIQKSLTVQDSVSVNGSLNVSGTASIGTLNTTTIAVRNLSISGPLTIGHLTAQGPTPTMAAGSVGSGGTVSISGNDTTGTININTGSGPGNTLATITFRASFSSAVHVLLTPLTSAAASSGAYVTRTGSSFQVHANTPPSGQTLSFDYLVVQ